MQIVGHRDHVVSDGIDKATGYRKSQAIESVAWCARCNAPMKDVGIMNFRVNRLSDSTVRSSQESQCDHAMQRWLSGCPRVIESQHT